MANPQPSLEELTTAITRQEFAESIYRVMAAVGMQTSSWKPGAVVRAFVTATSVVMAALSVLIALIARMGFLELSAGLWLRLCAWHGFDTPYQPATFAAGELVINNTGTLVFDEPAGEMRFIGPTGQEYVATQRVQVAANQSGVRVSARAVVSGSAGGAAAGTITQFGANYSGLTVTNPAAFVGSDDESDTALMVRARASAAQSSPNGPRDAYEWAALNAKRADGSALSINRVRVVRGPGDRSCTVYAATASGAVPGDANDPTTDLGRLQEVLRTTACPTGMTVHAASGIGLTVSLAYQVWIYTTSGLTVSQAQALIYTRVREYLRTMPLGGDRLVAGGAGFVFHEVIRSEIRSAIPNGEAFHVLLTTPGGDVACEPYSAIQVGSITGAVNLVNR